MAMVRSALTRTAVRNPRPASVSRRNFASSSHDDAHETAKWEKITYLGIAACTFLSFYNLSKGHPHHEEPLAYPYLHIRNKEFPWESLLEPDMTRSYESRGDIFTSMTRSAIVL